MHPSEKTAKSRDTGLSSRIACTNWGTEAWTGGRVSATQEELPEMAAYDDVPEDRRDFDRHEISETQHARAKKAEKETEARCQRGSRR